MFNFNVMDDLILSYIPGCLCSIPNEPNLFWPFKLGRLQFLEDEAHDILIWFVIYIYY